MVSLVELSNELNDANAPAPKPLHVTYKEYDASASVAQAALVCRKDIGRHNALDKLIGALQHAGIDTRSGFTVVTSRCSLELIHKAVMAKLGRWSTCRRPPR